MSSDPVTPTRPAAPAEPILSPPRPFFILDESNKTSDPELDGKAPQGIDAQSSPVPSSEHMHEQAPSSPYSDDTPPSAKPFSPPASVRSFSIAGSSYRSPVATPRIPDQTQVHYSSPDAISRAGVGSSHASSDLQRVSSYYASRPTTADHPTRASSGIRLREAFASPPTRPLTANSTSAAAPPPVKSTKRARSTMLSETTPLVKPWLTTKDPYSRISYFVTYGVMFLGVAASVLRCYFGYVGVPVMTGNLCLVLDDEFDGETDSIFGSGGNWFREIQLGGFGNGEFEMTTSSSNNSYISNGALYLVPTLTSDVIGNNAIYNGYTYNLTDCTYNQTQNTYPTSTDSTSSSESTVFDAEAYYQACGVVSNSTTGVIINPVQSARISTRNSASIRYGRVEVRAKMPTGDWLWPAIWMLPVNNTYGAWPISGEIDIVESRGNGPSYPAQGSNYVRGSLNWGPLTFLNAVSKTYGWWTERRSSYADGFHTYALEWTEDFMRIYVDTRLHYMLDLSFNEPFFERGDFPPVVQNGSESIALQDPWINGTKAAPFDQPFYLIMDVAVGGTNGWFPDNAGNKPWLDQSLTAMRDFATNQDEWYATWPQNAEDRGMVVDYVKMWQQC